MPSIHMNRLTTIRIAVLALPVLFVSLAIGCSGESQVVKETVEVEKIVEVVVTATTVPTSAPTPAAPVPAAPTPTVPAPAPAEDSVLLFKYEDEQYAIPISFRDRCWYSGSAS